MEVEVEGGKEEEKGEKKKKVKVWKIWAVLSTEQGGWRGFPSAVLWHITYVHCVHQ